MLMFLATGYGGTCFLHLPPFPLLLTHLSSVSSPLEQTNFYDGITNFNVCLFVIKFSAAAVLLMFGVVILAKGMIIILENIF